MFIAPADIFQGMETTSYNQYVFGGPNRSFPSSASDAVFDELLFWSSVKSDDFIRNVFLSYVTGM